MKIAGALLLIALLASASACTVSTETVTPTVIKTLTVTETVTESADTGKGFAIYFTGVGVPQAHMPDFLEGKPIISSADILAYFASTHEIMLNQAAFRRFNEMMSPTTGTYFVVCVDQIPVYTCIFVPMYSSLIFEGMPIIGDEPERLVIGGTPVPNLRENAIVIGWTPSSAQKDDPRGAPMIFDSLRAAGKLQD
jgi:hypothetical protein